MRKRTLLAALGACLAAAVMINPAASADPNAPTNRLLAGVGSDTTENVMNDFGNGRAGFAGIPALASWNTLPLNGTITTKAPLGASTCTFTRPFGSGAGVTRLITELNAAQTDSGRRSCVDFARSSSGPSGAGSSLAWVPFAVDGLTYATRADSGLGTTLTQAQLRSVYLCDIPNVRPLLPQAGSGTRSAWLSFVGVTNAEALARTALAGAPIQNGNADAAVQTCLSDATPVAGDVAGSVPLTENVGNVLDDPRQIVPYSIAQLRAQQSGAIRNDSGTAEGRRVNGIIPSLDDPAFPFRRLVYNVIPAQFATNTDYVATFGSAGPICSNPSVLRANGFAPLAAGDPLLAATGSTGCGDLTTLGLRAATAGLAGPPQP